MHLESGYVHVCKVKECETRSAYWKTNSRARKTIKFADGSLHVYNLSLLLDRGDDEQ